MIRRTPGIGDKWLDVCRRLNAGGVEYIVVGSVAMALHGEVRATKDIDVLVPRDLDNMKRLLDALGELPMGLARELDAATETRRAITIIGDDPRVDVMKGAGGLAYREARNSKKTARIQGVEIPYAGAACETPGAFGLAQSSILLVNTHSPWIADWMPALEDRRHAERWK